jgi:hypothetical protein
MGVHAVGAELSDLSAAGQANRGSGKEGLDFTLAHHDNGGSKTRYSG